MEIALLAAVGEFVLTVRFQKIDRLPALTEGAEEGSRHLGFRDRGAARLTTARCRYHNSSVLIHPEFFGLDRMLIGIKHVIADVGGFRAIGFK